MEQFQNNSWDTLQSELCRLGFPNNADMLRSALKPSGLTSPPEQRLQLQHLEQGKHAIQFIVTAQATRLRPDWHISLISGFVSMDDPITKKAGPRAFRAYTREPGYLPDINHIREDLAKAIHGDLTNRLIAQYPSLKPGMSHYGFDLKKDDITYSSNIGPVVCFTAQTKSPMVNGMGNENVNFLIGVLFDEKKHQTQVLSISGFLNREIDIGGTLDIKILNHIDLKLEDGNLQRKEQILDALQNNRIESVKKSVLVPTYIISPIEARNRASPREIKDGFHLAPPTQRGFKHKL